MYNLDWINYLTSMEEEKQENKRRRYNNDETIELKHHHNIEALQQDPDDIRLADGDDTPKGSSEIFQVKGESSKKVKPGGKHHPSRISFARGSKKCSIECKPSGSSSGNGIEETSLSDRICQVVWERKGVQLTPLSSRRTSHHRRGTAPTVPRHCFESKLDAFGGRSQSFKGLSLI